MSTGPSGCHVPGAARNALIATVRRKAGQG
jgi:hypothetical protein